MCSGVVFSHYQGCRAFLTGKTEIASIIMCETLADTDTKCGIIDFVSEHLLPPWTLVIIDAVRMGEISDSVFPSLFFGTINFNDVTWKP